MRTNVGGEQRQSGTVGWKNDDGTNTGVER